MDPRIECSPKPTTKGTNFSLLETIGMRTAGGGAGTNMLAFRQQNTGRTTVSVNLECITRSFESTPNYTLT